MSTQALPTLTAPQEGELFFTSPFFVAFFVAYFVVAFEDLLVLVLVVEGLVVLAAVVEFF